MEVIEEIIDDLEYYDKNIYITKDCYIFKRKNKNIISYYFFFKNKLKIYKSLNEVLILKKKYLIEKDNFCF